ncbi:hypothetical protein PVAG01_06672 [Phlyctema vagabunda]|uniref:Uncharacterized protein n=1 Tax=Phlyctema vagabunda TaxID=108571 RepID=A0ABR4PGQ5_9HELO
MPLEALMRWQPFRLDALGLVTLIGAEEVNDAVGRLTSSRYTTFLPLLGQHLVAGNKFTTPVPGYTLYNITDAITTTNISGWFSRWLSAQKIKNSTTVFDWTVRPVPQQKQYKDRFTELTGCMVLCLMITLTILMGDWWGLSNSVAIAGSTVVRWFLVQQNIRGLSQQCVKACYENGAMNSLDIVKVLVTLNNGKMVTVYSPRGLLMAGFTKRPSPLDPNFYTWARRFGWLFFGLHVVALGQCNLVTQTFTVVLLVGSTWLVVRGFGANDSELGDYISVVKLDNIRRDDRRMWAYAELQPTIEEEETLVTWNLLPRHVNKAWWEDYGRAKDAVASHCSPPNPILETKA